MIKAKFFSEIEKINKPTIISAFPTIGFSGKACIDKLVELTNSKLLAQFDIEKLPIVFVSKGKIEYPSIKLYHKKNKKENILFLTADYQPHERNHSDFAEYVIKMFKKINAKQLIIVGEIPQTTKKMREVRLEIHPKKSSDFNEKIPIMGFNAALISSAFQNKIPISMILKESKPNVLDIRFVRDSIKELSKKLGLGINLNKLEKEYLKEMSKIKEISLKDAEQIIAKDSTGYIG